MNSLLLFLFLGASVALAELPFEHPDFVEFLNEEDHEGILGELADEENDPHRHRPSGTPPAFVKVCLEKFRKCIDEHRPSGRPFTRPSGRPTRPAEDYLSELDDEENDPHRHRPSGPPPPFVKECLGQLRKCVKDHRPSRRPFTRPSRRPFTRPSGRPTRPSDEENDPHRHRPSGTPPAFVKECLEKFRKCIDEHRPSGRPFTRPSGRPTRPAEDYLSELDDEENDPHRHRPSGPPPPFVKECLGQLRKCVKDHRPSRRPFTRPSRRPFTRPSGRPTRPAE
ncbi:hypothetical protein ACROYT_G038229 [Oculina patagonica]